MNEEYECMNEIICNFLACFITVFTKVYRQNIYIYKKKTMEKLNVAGIYHT